MSGISIALIIAGALVCVTGTAKSIKSKFKDLNAIIWCFAGTSITVLGTLLTIYL